MAVKLIRDIKALLEGMGITGKHLGRHAITIQYPEEKWEMPERSRGMVVLLSDKETGELNCTACELCAKACPTAAIRIEAPRDPETKKKALKSFVLDHGLCCFCGLCEEACNFAAIKLATKYEFSTLDKDELVWDAKKLQEMGRDVPYEPKPKKKPKPKKQPADKAAEKPAAATAKTQKADSEPTESAAPKKEAAATSETADPPVADDKPKAETPDKTDRQSGEQAKSSGEEEKP